MSRQRALFCSETTCFKPVKVGTKCPFHHYETKLRDEVTAPGMYPVWPLLRLIIGTGDGGLYGAPVRTERAVRHAIRKGGFTERQADRLCCDLGLHPFNVYGSRYFSRSSFPSEDLHREDNMAELVDAAPYTNVLGDLYRQGESLQRMAEVCGLSRNTITGVIFGESVRIQARTANRLRRALSMFPESSLEETA